MTTLEYPIFEREYHKSFERFWDHNKLKDLEFKREVAIHPSFSNCFDTRNNLIPAFKEVIKQKTNGDHPNSIVIQIYGTQGDGKTVLGFNIGKIIDPSFSNDNVFMKTEALLRACAKAKPNTCLQLDEQTIQFGEGSQRQLADLQNIEEVTRIRQVHFIFCSPTLRTHLATHFTLKVLQRRSQQRLTKFAFTNKEGTYYYGYGLARIPKDEDCPIMQKYLPKKLEFAKETLERTGQKYNLWEMAYKITNHQWFNPTLKNQELMVLAQDIFPTMTIGEHKKIVTALRMAQTRKRVNNYDKQGTTKVFKE